MIDPEKLTRTIEAAVDAAIAIGAIVKLTEETAAMLREARAVATSQQAAEIDAALARLQARNDVEVPEAIAALRAQ